MLGANILLVKGKDTTEAKDWQLVIIIGLNRK